ncbi:lipopolysaccharide biosynthesis protein [Gracilibacillus timonensis]|uniref:lipopolysaccharide biosynthesis protein n=1 Tax=Gracilibacillus timonensis TaxID=1816696 RepID=UPI0008263AD5|nr:oligosaccharide flippase family protein [Gracilibacillus timonensis]
MQNRLKNLLKKSFVRNVFILASGTIAAQIITMAASPVITRMYGPEAFGIMGTFNALINIILPISALAYPIAIVLPKKDQEAKQLVKISLIVTVFSTLIALLLLLLFNNQIVNIFNISEISNFLFLIPLIVIFSGCVQIMEQWLIRKKQFSINAKVTFFQSLITNGGKICLGFFYPIASILVVITSFANGIRALMLFMFSRKDKLNNDRSQTSDKKKLNELAKKYYDFPAYRAPEMFINAISQGLPVLLLSVFFGPASAGFYSIGKTVLNLPTLLIGKSVGDVFYPRIAEAKHKNEDTYFLIKKATLALMGVGILPFAIIIIFGPYLFSFVFGSDWVIAGEYARWIALWSFCGFINRPSVRALPVLNAQKFHLIYTIIMLILRFIALAIGYFLFSNDLIAVALYSIAGALLNVVLIIATLGISKKR